MSEKLNKAKEPLVRIVKSKERSKREIMRLRIIAFAMALLAGGLFIVILGHSPLELYGTIISGAFRSKMAVQATVKFMIPLLISSLGVTLAFKMRFWNIGAEGQIIVGAICSSYFALFHSDWPHALLLLVMFMAGFAGGGLWGLIPAYFKSRFETNETLFTLMLNYIALHIISFLRDGPWKDPGSSGFPKIARFVANSQIDKVFGVQFGWIVGLLLVVVVYVYLSYTKHGYEISVVGESQATARYAGMNVKKIILRTMILSGGICGITGVIQSAGSDMTLASSVAGGVGFTAIIVAWLANLNPISILWVSFLFSVLEKGSSVMQSTYGISTYSADVLQGIILFFILGCEFYIRYKFVFRGKGGGHQ
ncbi:MAG: ABC transporter permease [Sedimentibacter sp.]|uniref:ABC transporter permease n=1 Tax=Sedimentibacter sp. TaxID=1960295 RepID=UPI0031595A0C